MADDSVQPVPWVFPVSMAGARNHRTVPLGRASTSFASFAPWPPFTSAAPPHIPISWRAARSIAASSAMGKPHSTSASGMLGVTTSASGSRRARRAATASSSMRRAPLVATITGSTTTLRAP